MVNDPNPRDPNAPRTKADRDESERLIAAGQLRSIVDGHLQQAARTHESDRRQHEAAATQIVATASERGIDVFDTKSGMLDLVVRDSVDPTLAGLAHKVLTEALAKIKQPDYIAPGESPGVVGGKWTLYEIPELAESVARIRNRPPELVTQWIARGIGAYAGGSSTGKTTMLLSLAVAIAGGQTFWQQPDYEIAFELGEDVMYLHGEMESEDLAAWCHAQALAQGVDGDWRKHVKLIGGGTSRLTDPHLLIADIRSQVGPDYSPSLIVLDSWTALSGIADRNDEALVTPAVDGVRMIRDEFGAESLVLITHAAKASLIVQEGGADIAPENAVRGSGALVNLLDFVVEFRKGKDQNSISLAKSRTRKQGGTANYKIDAFNLAWLDGKPTYMPIIGELSSILDPETVIKQRVVDIAAMLRGQGHLGRGSAMRTWPMIQHATGFTRRQFESIPADLLQQAGITLGKETDSPKSATLLWYDAEADQWWETEDAKAREIDEGDLPF